VIYNDERGYRLMRETMNKRLLQQRRLCTPPVSSRLLEQLQSLAINFTLKLSQSRNWIWSWTTSTSSLGAGLTRLLEAAATTAAGAPHRLRRTTTAVRTTPGDDEGVSVSVSLVSFSLGACSCLPIFAYQEGDAVSQGEANSNAHSIVLEKKLFLVVDRKNPVGR